VSQWRLAFIFSMSKPRHPPVWVKLQLSNNNELTDIPLDDKLLGNVWGGIFFHPAFVSISAKILGLNGSPQYLFADGKAILALNLITHKRPVRVSTLPNLYQYFGILPINSEIFGKGNILEVDNVFDRFLDYAYFSLTPEINAQIGNFAGWRTNKIANLILDKDGILNWGSDFLYMVRKQIKKARNNQIEIAEIDYFPKNIWKKSFERKGLKTPLSPEKLEQWCQALLRENSLKIFAAKINGEILAFRGQLIQNKFAYDWVAGSNPEFNTTGGNQLLMAEIGDYLRAHNIILWDLLGGQIKGIADFKRSFGAKDIFHYHISKCFSLTGNIYNILRKVRHGWR